MADKDTFYVEYEKNGKPTRLGPFENSGKAGHAHKVALANWNGKGKKPELTGQPAGWVGSPGMTKPTRRESPRTGKVGKPTIPGVPKSMLSKLRKY